MLTKNFAKWAHHLVKLTRKDAPFDWGPKQITAQEVIRAIDYTSDSPVILAINTSYLAVGYYLCQADPVKLKTRYYNRFGSLTLNKREARFSQPKLEIYYRAMRALKLYIIGIWNLVVEVDAKYIKGMLKNLDILPGASINQRILAILTFHFKLVHVPGKFHRPDGLSRRPKQPGDPDKEEDEEEFQDWIDKMYVFPQMLMRPTLGVASSGQIYKVFEYTTTNKERGRTEEDLTTSPNLGPVEAAHTKEGQTTLLYEKIPRSDKAKDFDCLYPAGSQTYSVPKA
ncbi:hypothetical protein PHLCEN_2v1898 [Hermanssonia centrifuga]|uniref:Reverse transcriptase/retrotransposon-derived protein RNase H-like domain-containing protein n=1 Tax=Hermanssonia centrifuga TaxID=98765 RepID=A0A2R6RVL1_9APHY|nr:hypothetical protein PHLCEN_2v1898 [Hermanssonia centrifuga]